MVTDLAEDEERKLADRLEALRHEHPDIPMMCRLGTGHIIDSILATADEVNAGLIVMGTHGHSGLLRRLLMGSVAESIVRRARCPVLTVKTPTPTKAPTKPREDSFTDRPVLATPY